MPMYFVHSANQIESWLTTEFSNNINVVTIVSIERWTLITRTIVCIVYRLVYSECSSHSDTAKVYIIYTELSVFCGSYSDRNDRGQRCELPKSRLNLVQGNLVLPLDRSWNRNWNTRVKETIFHEFLKYFWVVSNLYFGNQMRMHSWFMKSSSMAPFHAFYI